MELGTSFPHQAFTGPASEDRVAIRDFVQAVEGLGYAHLRCADHVLGADPGRHNLEGPYTHDSPFHEPFVLFGYLAAHTSRIRLLTSVLILSQRQTALVAKQAAEVQVLSEGRLGLGIGSGWNEVEYDALGVPFETRGPRLDDQIALLRQLWSERLVNFEGRFEQVQHAGINPLPPSPIPIWMGGGAPVMMRRIGRTGDGWMVPPRLHAPDRLMPRLERIRLAAEAAGRDPSSIGLMMSTNTKGKDLDEQLRRAEDCRRLGATHFTVSTNTTPYASMKERIADLRAFREAFGDT